MTRKGCNPLDPAFLKLFARLTQIHMLTHPERTARRYGISAEYVRRQWRNVPIAQMDDLADRLERLLSE